MTDKGPRLLDGLTSTMTYGQMRNYADTLNVTISSALLPAGMPGFYDETTRTILIDRHSSSTTRNAAPSSTNSSTGSTPTPPGPAYTARDWNAGHDAKPP